MYFLMEGKSMYNCVLFFQLKIIPRAKRKKQKKLSAYPGILSPCPNVDSPVVITTVLILRKQMYMTT